ncbi:MAG TPA: exonuclease domain-containing protein [Chloroflexia bacterium]|nr:exonuclease domain-containing protein [Chloroflexia bacterium]
MLDETSPLEGVTFAVVDVETTGLSPGRGDRICEVAVVRARAGQVRDTFTTLVNPQRTISPGARRVNGITATMVYRAPVFADVAGEVATLVRDTVLVGHNVGFDLGFLRNELPPAVGGAAALPPFVIDTLQLARACYQFPSNSLESISTILKLRHRDAHRALADALTTWRVLAWFINDLRDRGLLLDSLADLLAMQGRLDLAPRPYLPAEAPAAIVPPVINQAISAGRLLRLRYASPDGRPTDRLVAPRRVALEHETLYLVAFCHLRQEERTFRFDRILKLELCE